MIFVDTHCHLQMKTFRRDIERVVDNARAAGVKAIINVGFDVQSSEGALDLSRKYRCMYAAVGIHPHDAKVFGGGSIAFLGSLLREEKVVAVGEIGLDYYRNLSRPDLQRTAFREQLEFAKERDFPIILHIRDAYGDALAILEETRPRKAVLHCFSGTAQEARHALGMGYFLSFGGGVTYGGEGAGDAVREVPLSRMFVETDAPFLAPVPQRGRRNEPAFILKTAQHLAEIKEVSIRKIAESTTENACSFFKVDVSD